ncbi:MAG: T9SS type A sorting domain-containing protein, partial [candidate division WOR-3 bacterium]
NYPVDYDTTELIYKFTGLNPDLKYRLDITAYHESEGEWREWVKIDNTAQHLIKYDAGVPKTVELPVPPASYMNDGEIVMRITKIRGEFAMCHKGNLYEFEEEEGGGPQAVTSTPLNREFGLKILPNILSCNAQLQYSIPTKQHITLNLYDVIGRKVATILEEITEPGVYITSLNVNHLSAGIYFLMLTGEKEIKCEKMLIVK